MDLFDGVLSIFPLINPIILILLYSCQYIEVQAQLAALLRFHAIGIPVSSIATFAANPDIEVAYKQFCEGLNQIGVTEDMIQQKEGEILEILRSQDMVASSQICGNDAGDKDQVLETAYYEYCEDLHRMGFTEDLIPPKARILEILRSRGVVASSQSGRTTEDEGQLGCSKL